MTDPVTMKKAGEMVSSAALEQGGGQVSRLWGRIKQPFAGISGRRRRSFLQRNLFDTSINQRLDFSQMEFIDKVP
ncbi:MAG: hypothetical protein AAF289_02460 [Cyanobacteria bacterium P01_A01_bin.135]